MAWTSDNCLSKRSIPGNIYRPWSTQNATDLATPQVYTTRFSSRHDAGGDIVFSDAHAAHYRYSYVCTQRSGKPADPGLPDINWAYDGHIVP